MALSPPPISVTNPAPVPSSDGRDPEIVQFFQSLLNRDPTDDEYLKFTQTPKDQWGGLIKSQLTPDEQKFGQWGNDTHAQTFQTLPPDAGVGGGGGILQPFAEQFNAPSNINLGGPKGLEFLPPQPTIGGAPTPNLPAWNAPKPFSYDAFKAPSVEEAMADPGLKVGNANIQNWAAAKGTLNDSSTANALSDYSVHNYDSVFNRDLSAYNTNFGNSLNSYLTNYQTQNVDPYTHAYQAALDMNAPATSTWNAQNAMNSLGYSTTAAAGQRQNESNYSNAYNKWLADWQMFMDQRDSTFNKTLATATA